MKKFMKIGVLLVVVAVFIFSAVKIVSKLTTEREEQEAYDNAVNDFVTPNPGSSVPSEDPEEPDERQNFDDMVTTQDPESDEGERAPISVDFAAIRAVNEDVLGWIYCPDTVINYPVLQGTDNDQYLHHTYDGSYAYSGSIFVEATNSRDLLDSNTIIYGHHMRNGSMFGGLDQWEEQDYYEEHPIIWLLTPEQDYKIEILSAYTTSGYSVETYTIFRGPCLELDEYLETNMAKSVIDTGVQPEEGARYVLLSTCSRDFEDARFVIHGKLVPVESAGGTPIN